MIGRTISHYKITEKLGEGGMGVVYKAEDTKLDRTVALKFLAAHLLNDDEAKARFLREAKAAAALDHPNICTVYEIGEAEGKTFLSMAFIEGEPLEVPIERGPLPLKEALDIGRQIADGLEAAHEKGVVHRDIKPPNVMVDAKGHATIMDFGLARLTEASRLTKADQTMGTVAYMSPEQAQGMEVDKRSDIWALGVVLYEMVRGQRPFQGEYDQALLYEIVHEEPEPLTGVRAGVPMELEFIVGKCLAKDPADRYQSAGDAIVDLRTCAEKLKSGRSAILRTGVIGPARVPGATAGTQVATGALAGPEEAPSGGVLLTKNRLRLLQALLAVSVLVALGVSFLHFGEKPPDRPLRRFAIAPPVSVIWDLWGGGTFDNSLAISPNARHIAFVEGGGQGRLWVQDLDQQQPRAIEGTEGARSLFWSPDSTFIGFAAGGDLKKVSVQGGLASPICELPAVHFHGGTWSPDGEVIVFSSGPLIQPHSLYQVPARGGTPGLLLAPEDLDQASEGAVKYPPWSHFLPSEAGARVLVFTFGTAVEQTMVVQNLETGQREILGPGAWPVYSNSGHLLYATSPTSSDLWALPFSLETLRATGEAFPVSENSRYATVAADETLVYLDIFGSSGQQQLVWVDRAGKQVEEVGQAQDGIRTAALSPDDRWLAVAVVDAEGSSPDVWVWDLARRGVSTRLSTAPEFDSVPVWSPGGNQVAFASLRAGNIDIYLRPADGSGEEQAVAATSRNEWPSDWSRDGKYLLYDQEDPETGRDLWYLERSEDGSDWEPKPFLQEPSLQAAPKFSPNGRHVAYVSDESGQTEVYVQRFPEGGRKVTVSNSGGSQVRWSRDGKELFYVEGEKLMVVLVSTEGEFSAGLPTELFEHPGLRNSFNNPNYDVSLDGQRFILAEPVGYEETEAPRVTIRVVLNWFAEFKERQQE